jgi:hypothetical protein
MELNFNTAKGMATEYAKKFNKQIVGAKENAEYWFFEADNDEHPIDDGAGSCYISKKDGSLRQLNLIDMEFNSNFSQTAVNIDN